MKMMLLLIIAFPINIVIRLAIGVDTTFFEGVCVGMVSTMIAGVWIKCVYE